MQWWRARVLLGLGWLSQAPKPMAAARARRRSQRWTFRALSNGRAISSFTREPGHESAKCYPQNAEESHFLPVFLPNGARRARTAPDRTCPLTVEDDAPPAPLWTIPDVTGQAPETFN